MTVYTYDHMHLRSRDPIATARYFETMFGAEVLESVQSDGQPRVDLDLNGLTIFIARAGESTSPRALASRTPALTTSACGWTTSLPPAEELKAKGAEFSTEPFQLRPGVKIAFVQAPGNVRIELLERE